MYCFYVCFRMSYTELSRLGHWTSSQETSSLSYATLPSIHTIVQTAGSSSLVDYNPIWTKLLPPCELTRLVLSDYHEMLDVIEKVIIVESHWLVDFMCSE